MWKESGRWSDQAPMALIMVNKDELESHRLHERVQKPAIVNPLPQYLLHSHRRRPTPLSVEVRRLFLAQERVLRATQHNIRVTLRQFFAGGPTLSTQSHDLIYQLPVKRLHCKLSHGLPIDRYLSRRKLKMSSGFRLRTVLVPMNHGKITNRVFRSITCEDHHLHLLRRLICTLKETRNDMI